MRQFGKNPRNRDKATGRRGFSAIIKNYETQIQKIAEKGENGAWSVGGTPTRASLQGAFGARHVSPLRTLARYGPPRNARYTRSDVSGRSAMRTPTASAMALAIAAGTGMCGPSPMPRTPYGP